MLILISFLTILSSTSIAEDFPGFDPEEYQPVHLPKGFFDDGPVKAWCFYHPSDTVDLLLSDYLRVRADALNIEYEKKIGLTDQVISKYKLMEISLGESLSKCRARVDEAELSVDKWMNMYYDEKAKPRINFGSNIHFMIEAAMAGVITGLTLYLLIDKKIILKGD